MSPFLIAIGSIIMIFFAGVLYGSYTGRRAMLKDFGMDWESYRKKLNGQRPH
mgnify:CR=1 FL=1